MYSNCLILLISTAILVISTVSTNPGYGLRGNHGVRNRFSPYGHQLLPYGSQFLQYGRGYGGRHGGRYDSGYPGGFLPGYGRGLGIYRRSLDDGSYDQNESSEEYGTPSIQENDYMPLQERKFQENPQQQIKTEEDSEQDQQPGQKQWLL